MSKPRFAHPAARDESPDQFMGAPPRSSELARQLRRIREEYRDVPHLRLTPSGVQRVFGLPPLRCVEILEALLEENFLCRTRDGLFRRSDKRN